MRPPIGNNGPATHAFAGGRPRHWWWLATILTAAVASAVAFRQSPRGDPDRPVTWADKFLHPVETNAWLRVPDAHARHPREGFLDVRTTGDGRHAFAATTEGLVYRTADGGASWQVSQIGKGRPGYRFYEFDVASERRGWALGEDGVLFTSTDGMVSWGSVRDGVFAMAAFAGSDDVALVDEQGLARWNPDQKAPPRAAVLKGYSISIPSEGQPVSLLALPDGRVVIGRGDEVAIADLEQDLPLNVVRLPDAGSITRLSRCGGEVCARVRGGDQKSWVHVPAIAVAPPQRGFAPDPAGGAWWLSAFAHAETSDAVWILTGAPESHAPPAGLRGTVWRLDGAGPHVALTLDEQMGSPAAGRAAFFVGTSAGLLLRSTNWGSAWEAVGRGGIGLDVPDAGETHAWDDVRRYLRDGVQPAGERLRCDDAGCQAPAGSPPDGSWFVTTDGRVAVVRGGKPVPRSLPDGDVPFGVTGYGPARAIATGAGRNLYLTQDGGASWRRITYSASPARWFYASWLAVAALAFQALRRGRAKVGDTSVSDLLVSDHPLTAARDDVVGLHEVALALSRFFRNDRTQPSVTVAVTGEWGSGKSSLLNLLQQDLHRFGFSSVSFNAWHNEQESDPVAALYAAIVAQGVPRLPSAEAFRFRLKLLWQRRSGGLVSTALWLVLLPALVGYFLVDLDRFGDSVRQLLALFDWAVARIDGQSSASPSVLELGVQWAPPIAGLLGFIGVLRSRLSAFGVNPSSVVARLGRLPGSEPDRVGFHARFAEDFRRVTAALAPRRMVVCVDDLDRCEPGNALRILEAINFLAGSGECFVVIAASRSIIERDIEVASASMVGGLEGPDGKPLDPKHYARLYLEKLINVEVPVPTLDLAHAARLLAQCASPTAEVEEVARDARLARADRLQRASSWARGVRHSAILGGIVALAMWAGATFGRSTALIAAAADGAPAKANAAAAPSPTPPGRAEVRLAEKPTWSATVSAGAPFREPSVSAGAPAHPGWTFALPLAVLALLLVPLIRSPRGALVNDSDAFLEALRSWSGVILQRQRTPRALKGFLNKLRFAAMRRRSQEADAEDWLAALFAGWANGFATEGRPIHRVGRGVAGAVASWRQRMRRPADEPVHEEWLVALMALLGDEGAGSRESEIATLLKKSAPPAALTPEAREAYAKLPQLEAVSSEAQALLAALGGPRS